MHRVGRSFKVYAFPPDAFGIGIEVGTGATPEQAIINALPHVGSEFCSQCAGTRVSRRWPGAKGDVMIWCEACHSTGAPLDRELLNLA